jgi:protein tyrosine/serine phosphatase
VQRDVALGNVFNVRDLGGLTGADGHSVRQGRVYRAASLHQLDPAYAEDWERLAIRTVIDLRRSRERVAGGWPELLNSATVCELPMLPDDWMLDRAGYATPLAHLSAAYDDMQRLGMAAIRASFELLADPASYPLLFFCIAGKDRTGLLASLLLLVLGVSDEDVFEDYELSGERVIALVESLRAQGRLDGNPMINQPIEALRAPREALADSLARLRARHGSVEAYLASCGVSAETRHAVCANLLEQPVQ